MALWRSESHGSLANGRLVAPSVASRVILTALAVASLCVACGRGHGAQGDAIHASVEATLTALAQEASAGGTAGHVRATESSSSNTTPPDTGQSAGTPSPVPAEKRPNDAAGPGRIWVGTDYGLGVLPAVPQAPPQRLTDTEAIETHPVYSPDGRQIAFVRFLDEDSAAIYVMNADGTGARQVTGGEALHLVPSWSPDGQRLLFTRSSVNADTWSPELLNVWSVAPDGSRSVNLTNSADAGAFLPMWSQDGETILYTLVEQTGVSAYVMNADGSERRRVANGILGARWSPDGTALVGAVLTDGEGPRDDCIPLATMSVDGSDRSLLGACTDINFEGLMRPMWSWSSSGAIGYAVPQESGSYLYVADGSGSMAGEPLLVSRTALDHVWSPDGRALAYAEMVPCLWWESCSNERTVLAVSAQDGASRRLLRMSYPSVSASMTEAGLYAMVFMRPSWSPDGSRIVFTDGNGDLLAINARDSGLSLVYLGYAAMPKPTQGDTRIAFVTTEGGVTPDPSDSVRLQLVTIGNEGTDARVILDPEAATPDGGALSGTCEPLSLSPDGTRAIVSCEGALTITTTGGDSIEVSGVSGFWTVAWAPDGERIAFSGWSESSAGGGSATASEEGIFTVNADGTDLRLVAPQTATDLAWAPDGRQIAVCGSEKWDAPQDLYVMNLDGSGLTNLTDSSGHESHVAWSPDGQRLVYSQRTGQSGSDLYLINRDGSGQQRLTYLGLSAVNGLAWQP